MKQRSEIDELFYRLMGKAGEAYEIISAAALGIVKKQEAEHNRFLQGESGGRPYQIDGLLNGNIMVESKDYTIEDKKVGRPDLQKMQKGRGTGTCPNLKKAKSKRVSTRGCRPAFVCIYGQGLARQNILPFQNYFVSLQSEIEYLTSSKMTPKRSVGHPRKTAK